MGPLVGDGSSQWERSSSWTTAFSHITAGVILKDSQWIFTCLGCFRSRTAGGTVRKHSS